MAVRYDTAAPQFKYLGGAVRETRFMFDIFGRDEHRTLVNRHLAQIADMATVRRIHLRKRQRTFLNGKVKVVSSIPASRTELDHAKPTLDDRAFGRPRATEVAVIRDGRALDDIQHNMLVKATAFRDSHILDVQNMDELEAAVNSGNFARAMWCGERACEDAVKERTSASSRCMPFDQTPMGDHCVCCGKKFAKGEGRVIYFAKAY